MNTYSFGYDFGNSEICGVAVVNGRKIAKSIPTAISQESGTKLANIGIGMKSNHFIFRHEGQHADFFIGDLALEQGKDIKNGYGDPGRYSSKNALRALLTLSSTMIDDDEFALNVVTGIPVQAYTGRTENRAEITEALQGDHSFSVNKRKRTVHIRVERVIMEGAGAAIAYGSGTKELQGVIDIGGRTIDLYGSNGITPDLKYCHGCDIGVYTVTDAVKSSFEDLHGYPLPPHFLREMMYACANRMPIPFATARGKSVDMQGMLNEAMEQAKDAIISFVRSKWRSSESDTVVATGFRYVTVVGGGAYYFFDLIKRDIPHSTCPEFPEQANAYGYWKFAEQQSRRLRDVA
jgi:hypothetical protein